MSVAAPSPKPTALRTILLAGVIAGALDIAYVMIYFNRGDPTRIMKMLRGITAGLLGAAAVKDGGAGQSLLGLALHFTIALGAAAVFYAASRRIPVLTRHPLVAGVAYGAAVWLFMKLVVLPLDANPPKAFLSPGWVPVLVAHLICVGPPIAFIVRRATPVPPPAAG
jgi:hypothetical protein